MRGSEGKAIKTFKARGIVIKEFFNGESDKMITVLSFEYGKMRLCVRGGRKPGSKFHASAQLFAYSDFVIYKGENFFSLTQCEPVYLFSKIMEDYDSICYASYLAELTEKTVLEGETCDDILNLLLYALKTIEKRKMDLKLIRMTYEYKFLQLCGFMPYLDGCFECGKKDTKLYFGEFGLVCASCQKEKTVLISETAVYALNYIYDKDVKSVFSFKLSEEALDELRFAAGIFMRAHSDAYIKSVEFLT